MQLKIPIRHFSHEYILAISNKTQTKNDFQEKSDSFFDALAKYKINHQENYQGLKYILKDFSELLAKLTR